MNDDQMKDLRKDLKDDNSFQGRMLKKMVGEGGDDD